MNETGQPDEGWPRPKSGSNQGYALSSTKGRMGRLPFTVLFFLVLFVIPFLANALELIHSVPLLLFLIYIGCLMFFITISVRRLHDLDKSGWLALLIFVPFVNLIGFILLMFIPGSQGENKYGKPTS